MTDGGDFDLDQFKATYFEECNELIADAEDYLTAIKSDPQNVQQDDLHGIFRAVHSIKGGAGAFNFTQLVAFAHVYETLLDSMRDGRVAVTEEASLQLLLANDVLANLITAAQDPSGVVPAITKPKKPATRSLTHFRVVSFPLIFKVW